MAKKEFSEEQLNVKAAIKYLRLKRGYPMEPFAELIGVSRKQLEDLETTRTTYGAYVSWDIACACADVL